MSSPTDPTEHDFEAKLRQLLKAEADQVSPSAEGLNLIRERTDRNYGSAWLGLPWLRPAVAVAGAVLIAASVVISTPQVRDQVLEIVPAGADSEGAPNGHDDSENGGDLAAPGPSSDSVEDSTQPEHETEPGGPSSSPEREEEEPSEDDDFETTASCPPEDSDEPRPTESQDDEASPTPQAEEDCDPSAEPSDEDSGEGPSDGDGDPGDGDNGGGDNSGPGGGNNGDDNGDEPFPAY